MQNIRLPKDEILNRIKENRTEHVEIVEEARQNYKQQMVEKLQEKINDVEAGKDVSHHIDLPKVVDHTEDYDRAIEMIEMSVEDTLIMSTEDYARYVNDDWDWKHQFRMSNAGYTTGKFG